MSGRWTRHFVYRSERLRTTWKLRVGLPVFLALGLWITSGWWTLAIARSLVCPGTATPSDAILVENFDFDYLVFERAAELRRAGLAPRIFVPVRADSGPLQVNRVALRTTEVMADVAHLGDFQAIPIHQAEPISLNASVEIRDFLERERIRSVVVVAPLFRSRRSVLVYRATLSGAGIGVTCEPARGAHTVEHWSKSWHGIQTVVEQWIKLQYYRAYVLPFRDRSG